MSTENEQHENDIAIVGMAARLPGAADVRRFWRNLREGVESVRSLSDDELLQAGVRAETLQNPSYVKFGVVLDGMEDFDAEFFGFSPKEAAIMDPQHRHFLECAWEALEDAGHPPEGFDGAIGVFAGCGMQSYMMLNLLSNQDLVDSVGMFLLRHTGNDKDFLATRTSYELDLRGPSINVQTACSTSLVAVHLAVQSLLSGESDMALAGGVTIEVPHRRGYVYKEGEILSPDGHCRAFDHRSKGTLFGSGVGIVALRRLEDALADGDHVYAVIKGSAVNNDGSGKVGYLAPSVDGQSAAIAEALAVAGLTADDIAYVEAHGTGTPVGDPIEISALTRAFRQTSDATGFCGIGSVKTNIGHLDTAAGVASLIKAALAIQHGELPPSLNFEAPNPRIDFDASPFYVNHRLSPWKGDGPRRAGVNSLGVGGTNAHVVLEEAPRRPAPARKPRASELLRLSARGKRSLDEQAARLAAHLREHPDLALADVAFTLHAGRRAFPLRRVLAARDREEAIALLQSGDPRRVFTHAAVDGAASVVFLFPGGGAQYPDMGRGLLDEEPVFREELERGLAALLRLGGDDLRLLLAGAGDGGAEALDAARLAFHRPSLQLPALFIVELALARLWMSKGIVPEALIGHRMDENAAACLAGVMSFEDALGLVLLRGRLFERVPEGGMLSVPLAADALRPLLGADLDLAVVNGPELCVASGPRAALDALAAELAERDVEARAIPISIAAHSRMLEPVLEEFRAYLRGIELSPPEIPFVSNATGTWITDEEATDPDYWVEHLRRTVRFADGVATLLAGDERVFVEVGPGRTLGSLVKLQPAAGTDVRAIASLRHPDEDVPDALAFQAALGRAWACGLDVDVDPFADGDYRRVPLPGYAFQHARYWIEPGAERAGARDAALEIARHKDEEDFAYRTVWRETPIVLGRRAAASSWLVFLDGAGVGRRLAEGLRAAGHDVAVVHEGDAYYRLSADEYSLSPEHGREGYDALVRDLAAAGRLPQHVVHLWTLTADESFRPGSSFFHHVQERGFYSLFFLAQALGDEGVRDALRITVVSNGMQRVHDEELPHPEKATLLGPVRVIPRELSGVTCSSVDLALGTNGKRLRRKLSEKAQDELVRVLEAELAGSTEDAAVAWRDGRRFVQRVERERSLPLPDAGDAPLRERGVYLITGGLGGIGLVMAEYLARTVRARIVLVGRTPMPDRGTWDLWLKTHGPDDPIRRRIRKLRELETLGAELMLVAADVTDVEEMRGVVAEARRRFGAVNGVLHTAGVLRDDLLLAKTQGSVEEVFTPKVHGTLVLDRVFEPDELDFLLLFSSTSVAVAPAGQVDYVAANAFLDAFAQSRAGGRTRTTALAWGVWSEVGMAADAAHRMGRAEPEQAPATPEAARHVLFETRLRQRDGTVVLSTRLSPDTHWMLDEHRTLDGRALLPGTGFVELASAALDEIGETAPFEVRDLFFLAPLFVDDGASAEVRVVLRTDEEGYGFALQSRARLASGQEGWRTHAQARLLLHALSGPRDVDLAAIEARCADDGGVDENGLRSGQEAHLRFGPRWRVLRERVYGDGEGLARLELPPAFEGDLAYHGLHPALLDYATGWAMELIRGYDSAAGLWVPVSYESLRVHGPLGRSLRSWVRSHGQRSGDQIALFDVTLTDERGKVLVEIERFAIHRLDQAGLATQPVQASDLEREEPAVPDPRELSPGQRAFRHNLALGLTPEEGCRALERVLRARGLPHVLISSLPIEALSAQAEALAHVPEPTGQKFARPQLASDYLEPRDGLERTLVGFWEELLGVGQVGVRDDFFDLGGHSLIAVRLFAKIRRTFSVDFPISVLFEAPTIERCAALIREATGGTTHDAPDPAAAETEDAHATSRRRTRYKHLVAMHAEQKNEANPFFLVAGMFGNVLNLRHLANLVGADRPFWGLQARGLYGDHQPHETFEEMAADYLAEVRSVRPHGPYLLGGFSGGGITAYEMARQLREAGEEVALLVLLDTPLPKAPPLSAHEKALIHWQRLTRKGPGYLAQWAKNRVQWELGRLARRFQVKEEHRPSDFHSDAIEAAFRRALGRYEMARQPLEVTLFRPKLAQVHVLGKGRVANAERELVFHDNGWSPWVSTVTVHEVPGDHDSMVLEPNVRVLAARLRRIIEDVEDDRGEERDVRRSRAS